MQNFTNANGYAKWREKPIKKLTFCCLTLLLFLLSTTLTNAQKVAKLEQAANGKLTSLQSPVDWVTGAVNEQKAHFTECMTIPYHLELIELVIGDTYTVTIGWDTKKGTTQHAIDYLTSYDYTGNHDAFGHIPETINVLDNTNLEGVGGVSEIRYQIPSPDSNGSPIVGEPTATFNALASTDREMSIFNGTITSMTYSNQMDLSLAAASSELNIEFVATGTEVVLAWGGHIGAESLWGEGNSATAINGAPYHMFNSSCVGLSGCGSKEVQLQASAVESLPSCLVSGPTDACEEETNLIFTATTDTGELYEWSLINNTSNASIVGVNTNANVTVDPGTMGGSFEIQVVISKTVTSGALNTTCSQVVTVNSSNDAGGDGTERFCEGSGSDIDLEASGTGGSG
ncbi:MAG: hypothetical protein KC469_12585, partial [Flavobacteriaceae bacterium]|nr:hypothetical protein [Flavobacteriaceae bacterium]